MSPVRYYYFELNCGTNGIQNEINRQKKVNKILKEIKKYDEKICVRLACLT